MNKINVPFVDLTREANFFMPKLLEKTKKVLISGQYINGPFVKLFEEELTKFFGVKHVITVGNGSDALTFILKALNLGNNDEIICPANSFIASAWSIIAAGCKPVFCDVTDDFLLDPYDFERKITSRTKAVMPVHLTGRVFEVNKIKKICDLKNIKIVEDAAQSFGAKNDKGLKTGSFGIAGAFSLHPLKNLSIYGDGGIITTNSDEIARKCNLLRNHGLKNRDEATIWGYNSRLDEIQAAFGLVKLEEIDEINSKYIDIAKFYDKNLENCLSKPIIRNSFRDIYHNYVITIHEDIRDTLIKNLKKVGISSAIHYPIPLHLQKCADNLNYSAGDIPNVELYAKRMISLPIFPFLTKEELEAIIINFNRCLKALL
tara:strand:- start:4092 stop:5213 length:1122 start_codon:yes stop_codon:yes gene_type:complete